MTLITAWLEINASRLPDCISAMLFSVDESCRAWSRIVLDRTASHDDGPPLAHSSEGTAIVRFGLPANMECAKGETLREIGSVGDVVGPVPSESSIGRPLATVAVPCLPAVFAHEIFFSDDRGRREFESTVKRLLAGRGEWIRTRSTNGAANGIPCPAPASASQPGGTRDQAAEKHERLAAAVATTVLFARAEIGGARTITFDTGSVALLRQIVTGDPSVPKRKTLETDAKELIKQLLAAAKKQNMKPGPTPRTLPLETSYGLQVAGLIEAELRAVKEFDAFQSAWLPTGPTTSRSEPESIDHVLFGRILTSLLGSTGFPSITRLLDIIRSAKQDLASSASSHQEAQEQAAVALSIILENIENPDQRVDRFAERFKELPALVGAAYAFWGWSSSPLQNFEQRVQSLKETLPGAHQAAWILLAAATGSSGLRSAYLRSRLWLAVYRATWTLLLAHMPADASQHTGEAAWNVTPGDLKLRDTGPLLEVRVGEFEIPLGLQVIDRRLALRKKAEELLLVPQSAVKAADAILAAVDGDLSEFTVELKRNIRRDVTIHLAGNSVARMSGSTITAENLSEKDLTIALRWDDAEQAAGQLSRGKVLERILRSLSDAKLMDLASEWTDAGPAGSD